MLRADAKREWEEDGGGERGGRCWCETAPVLRMLQCFGDRLPGSESSTVSPRQQERHVAVPMEMCRGLCREGSFQSSAVQAVGSSLDVPEAEAVHTSGV